MEEAILLLFIPMRKIAFQEIRWNLEITFALSVSGQFEFLADHVEQILPGIYNQAERWYLLALCYSAAGQEETTLNLLHKASGNSESRCEPHLFSLLLGATLCSQNPKHSSEGVIFAFECMNQHCKHLKGQAHKSLSICYGNAARNSDSDSQRVYFQSESLNHACVLEKKDPEIIIIIIYHLALENAVQRNLNAALEYARMYLDMMGGSSGKGWKLLSLILSRFEDAETIVDLALDEAGRKDQLELLRLKALIQIAQDQPKHAIETFRVLFSLIQAQKELKPKNHEVAADSDLEIEVWLDLTNIYTRLGSWSDAGICSEKAKSIRYFSPDNWHAKGLLFEALKLSKGSLVTLSIVLSIDPENVPSRIHTEKPW